MTPIRRSCNRERVIKSHWRPEEDDLLTSLVHVHGPEKWDKIAAQIPGRTGNSCRVRWVNQLNPGINKTPFCAHENRRLLQLHREYGSRWSKIAPFFPSRTDLQMKNQYHKLTGARFLGSSSITDPSTGLSYRIETKPAFIDGASSVYGQGETFTWPGARSSVLTSLGPTDGDSVYRHQSLSCGNSMVSDGTSAEGPVPQPEKGVGTKEHQFIDFLGVGSSE